MRTEFMPSICVPRVLPDPSLKRSANSRPPGPVRRYAVHFRQPGPGGLLLALRLSEGLGSTRGTQMLGMNSVLMGLALEDKVRKTEVFIPTSEVEGQRSVIVDPGREPED